LIAIVLAIMQIDSLITISRQTLTPEEVAVRIEKAWNKLTMKQKETWEKNAFEIIHSQDGTEQPFANALPHCVSGSTATTTTTTSSGVPDATLNHTISVITPSSHVTRCISDIIAGEAMDRTLMEEDFGSFQYGRIMEESCHPTDAFIGQEIYIVNPNLYTTRTKISADCSYGGNPSNVANQLKEYRAMMKEYDTIVDNAIQERKKLVVQWYQSVSKESANHNIHIQQEVDFSTLCQTYQRIIDQANMERSKLSQTIMTCLQDFTVMLSHCHDIIDDDELENDNVSCISCETIDVNSLLVPDTELLLQPIQSDEDWQNSDNMTIDMSDFEIDSLMHDITRDDFIASWGHEFVR
jgi:hypothetical protein